MKTREIERALAVADPVGGARLDGLDFKAMEGELLADLDDEQPAPSQPGADVSAAPRARAGRRNSRRRRHRPRRPQLRVLDPAGRGGGAATDRRDRCGRERRAGAAAEGRPVRLREGEAARTARLDGGPPGCEGGPLHRRGAPGTYTALVPVVLESWSGPSAGREREVMGAPQFISPAERRRWQRAGSPLPGTFDPSGATPRRRIPHQGRRPRAGGAARGLRRPTPEAARSRFGPNRGLPLVNKLPTRPEALRHAVQRNTTKGLGSADGSR